MLLCLTLTGFSDAFFAYFGFPCYILTQCGIYFLLFCLCNMFLHSHWTFNKSSSIKFRLQENLTILGSIVHGIFIEATSRTVTDLNDAEREKRNTECFQRLEAPPESFSKTICWKIQKKSVNKNPEFLPHFVEPNEPSR